MSDNLRNLITHLRFPFSLFLLPVFLFAWAHHGASVELALPIGLILHLLVYPSSNGFNSLMDRDTESIGGIEHPTEVPAAMRWWCLGMDAAAVLLAWGIYSAPLAGMVLAYIVASRLYSHRSVRIKRFAILGFLWVCVFQGGFVFYLVSVAVGAVSLESTGWLAAGISSLIIAASYPLTQIFQHKQDLEDGVRTFSWLLGVRGTMHWSLASFGVFMIGMAVYVVSSELPLAILLVLVLFTSPASLHLFRWTRWVYESETHANYRNTMKMSVLGSTGLNLFFLTFLIYTIVA